MIDLIIIFIAASITSNFVLAYFLGICPFIGVSNKIESAVGLGVATTFVMAMAATVTWIVYHQILVPFNLIFLQYAAFIMVIACLVQFVEMVIKKISPALYKALGIFLPLITTNCAVLGLTLFMVLRNYKFVEAVVFGLGAGVGFSLALVLMAGIREELEYANIPEPLKGTGITLILAGMLALAFMGFGGLISG